MANFLSKSDIIPKASWNLFDVAIVWILSVILLAILAVATQAFISVDKIAIKIYRYEAFLLGFFLPILWIRKRYGLSINSLGLRKGNYSYSIIIVAGALVAVAFLLIYRISPFWNASYISKGYDSYHYMHIFLLPLSVSGFAALVLTPIWEETMYRGFIYGYLRKRVGVIAGLVLQSLIFSFSHIGFVFGDFFHQIIYRTIVGIILGLLYEQFGSIYSSIICHSLIGYFGLLIFFYWK